MMVAAMAAVGAQLRVFLDILILNLQKVPALAVARSRHPADFPFTPRVFEEFGG